MAAGQILDQLCLRFAAPKFNPYGFFWGKLQPKCMKKSGVLGILVILLTWHFVVPFLG